MRNAAAKLQLPDSSLFDALQADIKGFEEVSNFLKSGYGINLPLNAKNQSLVASRLLPILRSLELTDYTSYLALVRKSPDRLLPEFICSLTTNTTEFFRESAHYDLLKSYLPQLLAKKSARRELRIWCAASSTGQEPYSILMTLLQAHPELERWNLAFLASDVDHDVLVRASEGIYTESEVKNVSLGQRETFFRKPARTPARYQVKPSLSDKIRFAEFNLLTNPYPFRHRFDIVFCRNVLIYFDKPTSESVVSKITETLNPGGYLFLGHSESGVIRPKNLTSIAPAVYRKNENQNVYSD